VANVSQHLKKLREGHLLSVERAGVSRIYRLADDQVALLLEDLLDLTERLSPEFRESLLSIAPAEHWSPLTGAQALREVKEERGVLLDVRSLQESTESPVPGAMQVPLEQLEAGLRNLPRSKTYYLVCRGRACLQASEGVALLRQKGLKAFRIKESPAALRAKKSSSL
jgi:ArsR family transcriptional regulator